MDVTVEQTIASTKLIPVVIMEDKKDAVPLAKALRDGGFPMAEVTFRTDMAKESIEEIAKNVPEVLVGAGTVLTVEMAKQALDAGANYIVTPGFSEHVASWCIAHNIPIIPGVISPTEIQAAMNLGLDILKFFPAEQAGGIGMLKAFLSPYQSIRFIPTGGICQKNIRNYLALQNVIACGGSWICPSKLIKDGKFDEIAARCGEVAALI
jgi:2-dehydro-3-deoxyphosphogluconate aldolase/(4S)-4-hydroxy-2-oxoglutarate aldolase